MSYCLRVLHQDLSDSASALHSQKSYIIWYEILLLFYKIYIYNIVCCNLSAKNIFKVTKYIYINNTVFTYNWKFLKKVSWRCLSQFSVVFQNPENPSNFSIWFLVLFYIFYLCFLLPTSYHVPYLGKIMYYFWRKADS